MVIKHLYFFSGVPYLIVALCIEGTTEKVLLVLEGLGKGSKKLMD